MDADARSADAAMSPNSPARLAVTGSRSGAGGRAATASRFDGFPGDVEQVVVLRNGASVRLRPIRADDAPRLIALCHRLSPRTIYQRFFSPRPLRPEEADALANVDYRERMALVAEVDTGQEPDLIGVARYGPAEEAAMADIGLVVEDGWQGLGLGSILLKEILHAGARQGIRHFRADVLTENRRALRLLARHTIIAQSTTRDGIASLTFRRRENSAAGELKPWGESSSVLLT
jgi:RimJ/RimL family protein N-acetyltransferase